MTLSCVDYCLRGVRSVRLEGATSDTYCSSLGTVATRNSELTVGVGRNLELGSLGDDVEIEFDDSKVRVSEDYDEVLAVTHSCTCKYQDG